MKRIVLTLALLSAATQVQASWSFDEWFADFFGDKPVVTAPEIVTPIVSTPVVPVVTAPVAPEAAVPAVTSGCDFSKLFASAQESVVVFVKDNQCPLACAAVVVALIGVYKLCSSTIPKKSNKHRIASRVSCKRATICMVNE